MENSDTSDKPSGGSALTASTYSGWAYDGTTYQVGSYSGDRPGAYDRAEFTITSSHFEKAAGQIACWVYFTTFASSDNFVVVSDGDNDELIIKSDNSDDIIVEWFGNGTETQIEATGANFTTGNWYFIVAMWEQGAAGDDLAVYVYNSSGTLIDSASAASITAMTDDPTSLIVGAAGAETIDMHLDNLFISNDTSRSMVDARSVQDFS